MQEVAQHRVEETSWQRNIGWSELCLKLCQPLDCELCRGGFNLLRNRGGRYFAGEEFERSVCYTLYRRIWDRTMAGDGQADHRDGNPDCFVTNSWSPQHRYPSMPASEIFPQFWKIFSGGRFHKISWSKWWNWKSKSIKQLEYDFVVISIFQLVLVFDLFGRLLINNFALWSIMVQIWSGVFLQVVMVMVSQRWDGWWWCWWLPSSGTPSNVPARVVSYLGKDRHTHRAGLCKSSSPDWHWEESVPPSLSSSYCHDDDCHHNFHHNVMMMMIAMTSDERLVGARWEGATSFVLIRTMHGSTVTC